MEEGSVTVDGQRYELKKPFFVMGTQNPYEEVGTFRLPASQLDRFICALSIGYPERQAERDILSRKDPSALAKKNLLDSEQIETIQNAVNNVYLSDTLLDYLQEIIALTRDGVYFTHGLSTRGALALAHVITSYSIHYTKLYEFSILMKDPLATPVLVKNSLIAIKDNKIPDGS